MEIEARFINLDQKEVEEKLVRAGAKKVSDKFFKEKLFYHNTDTWIARNRRIRVRDDGATVRLTYKENEVDTVDGTTEIEFEVSSAEAAAEFILALDIPLRRYQEKKRITYKLDDITFDLDFWPKIPMVLEIEAPSEEAVRKGADLLGLDWNDAIFVDQSVLHKKYYGIDLRNTERYVF
ncbi:MAG: CYTH domain-containing protein [Candidatus Spechtbacterales bacterium]